MIIFYPGVAGSTDTPLINALNGQTLTNQVYAEFVLKITAQVGSLNGSRRSTLVSFGMVDDTQAHLEEKAGAFAQLLESMSVGTVVQFYKKLGSYVKKASDYTEVVPYGATQYGILNWTNANLEGDGNLQTVADGGGGQVIIPFCNVDTISENLSGLTSFITGGGLARAKFTPNSNSSSFTVYISRNRLGLTIKDFSGLAAETTTRSDPSSGISDGVLSNDPSTSTIP